MKNFLMRLPAVIIFMVIFYLLVTWILVDFANIHKTASLGASIIGAFLFGVFVILMPRSLRKESLNHRYATATALSLVVALGLNVVRIFISLLR